MDLADTVYALRRMQDERRLMPLWAPWPRASPNESAQALLGVQANTNTHLQGHDLWIKSAHFHTGRRRVNSAPLRPDIRQHLAVCQSFLAEYGLHLKEMSTYVGANA